MHTTPPQEGANPIPGNEAGVRAPVLLEGGEGRAPSNQVYESKLVHVLTEPKLSIIKSRNWGEIVVGCHYNGMGGVGGQGDECHAKKWGRW